MMITVTAYPIIEMPDLFLYVVSVPVLQEDRIRQAKKTNKHWISTIMRSIHRTHTSGIPVYPGVWGLRALYLLRMGQVI